MFYLAIGITMFAVLLLVAGELDRRGQDKKEADKARQRPAVPPKNHTQLLSYPADPEEVDRAAERRYGGQQAP